jgi:hypothetical protein
MELTSEDEDEDAENTNKAEQEEFDSFMKEINEDNQQRNTNK